MRKVVQAATHLRAARAEEGLLGLLILHPDFIKSVSQRLNPESMVTDFNKGLYERLLSRFNEGQLIDLAFLSSDYEDDEMAYISRMVQNARENVCTTELAAEYADIIKNEHSMLAFNNPDQLPEDKINEMLDVLRSQRK